MLELLKPFLAILETNKKDFSAEVNEEGVEVQLEEEETLAMGELVVLVGICSENGLEFEIDVIIDYTTRCGFLAYDSSVWSILRIKIKEVK